MYYVSNNRPCKILNLHDIETFKGQKYYSTCSHSYGYRKFPVYETPEQAWDSIIEQCDKTIQQNIEFKQQIIKMKEADLNYEF